MVGCLFMYPNTITITGNFKGVAFTVAKKKITVRQFIDAVEADGLPKASGTLFRNKPRGTSISDDILHHSFIKKYQYGKKPELKIGAACAVGQACINLGIEQPSHYVVNYIIGQNDNKGLSLKDIADKARARYKNSLDETFEADVFDYTPFLDERWQPKKVEEIASAS